MYLNRKDLEKIQEVLKDFPDVDHFELTQEGGSGIGSITTMTFTKEVNGYYGNFSVEISTVKDW